MLKKAVTGKNAAETPGEIFSKMRKAGGEADDFSRAVLNALGRPSSGAMGVGNKVQKQMRKCMSRPWKKSCGGKHLSNAENAELATEFQKFQKAAEIQKIAHGRSSRTAHSLSVLDVVSAISNPLVLLKKPFQKLADHLPGVAAFRRSQQMMCLGCSGAVGIVGMVSTVGNIYYRHGRMRTEGGLQKVMYGEIP
jgi:hypothetical protein